MKVIFGRTKLEKYLKAVENYYSSEHKPYVELDSAKQLFHSIFSKGVNSPELRILITGGAGFGKTTMLDQLALRRLGSGLSSCLKGKRQDLTPFTLKWALGT